MARENSSLQIISKSENKKLRRFNCMKFQGEKYQFMPNTSSGKLNKHFEVYKLMTIIQIKAN